MTRQPSWRGDGRRLLGSGLRGGWFEGDGVSEGLELAYGVGLDGAGPTGGEIVRAGISVAVTVGEHAVRGHDHRPLNGVLPFHRSPMRANARVLGVEVGVAGLFLNDTAATESAFE